MTAQEPESSDRGERLDWEEAEMHPKTVAGFVLVVRGVAPVPMTVSLRPMPIGIVPDDYRGVEVLGVRDEAAAQVQTPWSAQIDTDGVGGRVGIVLIGMQKREYFPPKDEAPKEY